MIGTNTYGPLGRNVCPPAYITKVFEEAAENVYIFSGPTIDIPDDTDLVTGTLMITTEDVPGDLCIQDLDFYVDIKYDWDKDCVETKKTCWSSWFGKTYCRTKCTRFDSDGGINDLEVDLLLQGHGATIETRILDNDCGGVLGYDEGVKELYSDEGLSHLTLPGTSLTIPQDEFCWEKTKVPVKPAGDLGKFDGQPLVGKWDLKVSDNRPGEATTKGGRVKCWALIATTKKCVSLSQILLCLFCGEGSALFSHRFIG